MIFCLASHFSNFAQDSIKTIENTKHEPANPRDPVSIWNLSTISPEQMRPLFEIQDKEYS